MKKIFKVFSISMLFLILSIGNLVFAATTYSSSDVQKHNTTSDCWVIYEGQVFNITDFLSTHDTSYYFIDSWCGTDITAAYNTKDGRGIGHRTSTTTNILASYYIGDFVDVLPTATSTPVPTVSVTQNPLDTITPTPTPTLQPTVTPTQASTTTKSTLKNPYDFWTPFLIVFALLWGSYFLSKTNYWKTNFKPLTFKMFWNSMMLISLIPSALFGLFMILRYSYPDLNKINFDFLYWHVEGSICFVVIVSAHIILRLQMYFAQVRYSFSKPKVTVPTTQI